MELITAASLMQALTVGWIAVKEVHVLQEIMISVAAPSLHHALKVKVTATAIGIAQVIWSVEGITAASLMQVPTLAWTAVLQPGVRQEIIFLVAAPLLHHAPKVKVTATAIVIVQVIWFVEKTTAASSIPVPTLRWTAAFLSNGDLGVHGQHGRHAANRGMPPGASRSASESGRASARHRDRQRHRQTNGPGHPSHKSAT